MTTPLLQLKNISKQFLVHRHPLYAVQDISLSIQPGETLGLAGESGCGKSTLAKLIVRLMQPTAGSILFEGQDIHHLNAKIFGRHIQMVFQNPSTALNPKMTVREILNEPLDIHGLYPNSAKLDAISKLLHQVGLQSSHLQRLPEELSGGQKQRVNIARALALQPRLLICDEPLAALDRSTQGQIVELLMNLQKHYGLSYLFISHDLSTMRILAHRIAVMYLGHLVELAPSEELCQHPLHPYTQALLSAIPIPNPQLEKQRTRIVLKGEMPSPFSLSSGCPFYSRCPFAQSMCKSVKPQWKEAKPGHFVACHLS